MMADILNLDLQRIARLIPGYDPFATAPADCWFDEEAAAEAIAFFPERLRHVEGSLAGQPFVIEPWQQAIVGNLFGWQRKDTKGRTVRRYREGLLFVARKNGKTPLCAGIGLYCLFCDSERGQQNYVAASTKEQAGLLFRHCRGMIEENPDLVSRCRIYGGNAAGGQSQSIVRQSQGSFLKVISGDVALGKHGKNVNLAVIDELHEVPGRELVESLRTSMASANKPQPLLLYATTSDFEHESMCNEVHDYACRVRDGKVNDPAFLPVVYEAKLDDDWRDPKVWTKANPNLGVSVNEEYLVREAARCQDDPALLNTFLRLHLNIRTKQQTRWLDPEAWQASAGVVDAEALVGRECGGGLDLSAKYDLTAFVLVFPDGENYKVLSHFWTTEKAADAWERKLAIPYSAWAREGFITLMPGASIEYDVIEDYIQKASERYQIKAVGFDPWNANATRTRLEGFGLVMVEFPQNIKRLNEPTKEFGKLVKQGRLHHGDHPVLNFCAESVEVYTDASGNIRPVKPEEGSGYKIDGIVAAIMALDQVLVIDVPSAYESGDVHCAGDLMQGAEDWEVEESEEDAAYV